MQHVHADEGPLKPGREEGGFVEEILKIRAGEACGGLGNGMQVHVFRQRLVPGVDPKDGLPALDVRQTDVDLTVEPAGTQEGGV